MKSKAQITVSPSPLANEVIVTISRRKPFEYIVTGVHEPERIEKLFLIILYVATKNQPGELTVDQISDIECQAAEMGIKPSPKLQMLIALFEKQHQTPEIDVLKGKAEEVAGAIMRRIMSAHPRMSMSGRG